PFRKIYDKEALRDCLVNETFREDSYENDMEYTEKYIQYDSIDAAKNMAELVFHGNMCDMPTIDYSFNKEKKRRVLHYPNVKTAQTIDTIAQIAKKDEDVVIFEKRFFNPELSSHLHDNYLDDFDYIFITRTLPRTYAEEVLKRKSAKIRKELHKREIKRCFADLPVYSKFETEYYHGEAGETFSFNKKKMINASMQVMEDHLEIKFEEGKKGQPKKLLLVNKKSQIIYTRDLTEKEWKDHCIKEYFDEFLSLEIADMNGRYQLMIELEDENGNKLPYFFVDRKEYAKRKEVMDELDKSSVYMTGIKKHD
ncbi:MAG TPA: CDP-glycerol--poly(glycerophosphate) glycerophosphotransferase, partial [Anaerostipes hadrus]|nr:CDP-glycerol--poly(glycerophosphate) glycerophosphotransferase [Anaerostipes hadrus]